MIRKAIEKDIASISELLGSENLPVTDIHPGKQEFYVAEENGALQAAAALEFYGDAALLRSVIVNKEYRSTGLAASLLETLDKLAREKGVSQLYLITNTAEQYFMKKGFKRIEKPEVNNKVLASAEFNGLCPASSVIMLKSLL